MHIELCSPINELNGKEDYDLKFWHKPMGIDNNGE